jgi:hypothetical protein
MHPEILRQLAAAHTQDLTTEASQARRAREARHTQRRRLAAQLRAWYAGVWPNGPLPLPPGVEPETGPAWKRR